MVRAYAQYMGIAIIAVGVVGLMMGERSLLNILNIDMMEDIVHLFTGGLMAYVGYASRDLGIVKTVVGAIGVTYLLVGVLGFITPTLWGLLPHGYSMFDNLLHLVLGAIGMAMPWYMEDSDLKERAAHPSLR